MRPHIVQSLEPITLFGGGEADSGTIALALDIAPFVVAADGGANLAMHQNIVPKAVIGDFDSISQDVLSKLASETLFKIDEQDSTDFDKALRNISAPMILAVGFTGGRIDHQLAAFNALIQHADKTCVVIGASEIVFVAPQQLTLELPVGSVFSLFPLGNVSGTSLGLKWPIDGLDFSSDGRVGTSNEVSGPIELTFDAPNMLVVLPRAHLHHVVQALLKNDAQWSSRAE
jgi:thiamine pyrophosphokinase